MTTKFISVLFFFVLGFSLQIQAQDWTFNYEQGLEASQKTDKLLMLVFQGSDWCTPCIKLEKKIWQSEAFINYSNQKLILVKLDFPRKKVNQLDDLQKKHNNKKAEKFNPNGYFPLVVVMNSNGKVLDQFGYENWSVDTYIKRIDRNN